MLPAQVGTTSHVPLSQVAVAVPETRALKVHAPVHVASVLAGRMQLLNVAPFCVVGGARHLVGSADTQSQVCTGKVAAAHAPSRRFEGHMLWCVT
jgi:hypothetical protein